MTAMVAAFHTALLGILPASTHEVGCRVRVNNGRWPLVRSAMVQTERQNVFERRAKPQDPITESRCEQSLPSIGLRAR